MKFVHLALLGLVSVQAVSINQLEENPSRLAQVFDDDEEEVDCDKEKDPYDKRVCKAWKAHHDKVAAHKKKYESIGQKQAHALMQAQVYDDEPRDCSEVKDDYEKRVCLAWRAHDERVINHHTKFPSLYQLMDDPDAINCDDPKLVDEKQECLAWKARHQYVKDFKDKYGEQV